MDFYFDKDSLLSFLMECDRNQEEWKDVKRAILTHCSHHGRYEFNQDFCPYGEGLGEDFNKESQLLGLWKKECDDYNVQQDTKTLSTRHLPEKSFSDFGFIAILEEEKICQILKKRNLLVCSSANLNQLKSILIRHVDGSDRSETKTFFTPDLCQKDIEIKDKWNALRINCTPTSDIIIVDPYLCMNDKKTCIKLFIKSLLTKDNERPTNIICFIERWTWNKEKKTMEKSISDEDINSFFVNIRQELVNEQFLCNFTIVMPHYIQKQDEYKLHDRFVITNYRLIISGHSFSQYFDESGNPSAYGSKWLIVSSTVDKNIQKCAEDALKNLQNIIDERCEEADILFFGSKTSNLLKLK